MKKILFFLTLSISAAVILSGVRPTEGRTNAAKNLLEFGSRVVSLPTAPLADTCYTFTVNNASPDSLGDVTINGATSYAEFYVTGTGQYQQTLCFTAVSATIDGTVIPYPNSANIQLPSGAKITAGWQSPSLIEVATQTTQDTPVE